MVTMDGRIDSSNADQLHDVMKSLNEDGRYKIIFNMSNVDFMSSKGWWVLIETQKVCKRYNRGELVLTNVQGKIRSSDDVSAVGSF
jgi:anti-sigma B factor antagonist